MCSLASLFCATANAAEPQPIKVELSYTAIIDGITAATIDANAEVIGDKYVMVATTRTRGVMDMLVGFRSAAGSTAVIESGKPVPLAHDADNKWRGKSRHVHLRYDKGEISSADVAPTAEEDDRDPISSELQESTVDPISAALSLMIAAQSRKGCADLVPVFDGRRRYEFACTSGKDDVAASASDVDVFRRAYLFTIVAGRQKHPFWPQSKTPKAISLWFARIDPRLPPIVTKIAARAGLIGFSVRLEKLRIDGQETAIPSD
ncbi:MAG: DUF3108 domain-containing protein [Alphaproteobacteria bacterium]